jgi:hypothetical protein
MLAWFGHAPSFHDAEIVNITLNRRRPSHLKIHYWVVEEDGQG